MAEVSLNRGLRYEQALRDLTVVEALARQFGGSAFRGRESVRASQGRSAAPSTGGEKLGASSAGRRSGTRSNGEVECAKERSASLSAASGAAQQRALIDERAGELNRLAAQAGVTLVELRTSQASLEETFFELVGGKS